MELKKVLILGATGMLGSACRQVLMSDTQLEIIGTSRNPSQEFVELEALNCDFVNIAIVFYYYLTCVIVVITDGI